MLEGEESCQTVSFTSVLREGPTREIAVKLSTWRILSVTFLLFTHTIYTLITHKNMRDYSKRKTLDIFSTTHTPIFQRESYSSLVRNHCNLFSFPLPLPYLRGDLYLNTTYTYLECRKYFRAQDALEICQKKPVRLVGCNQAYCGIQKVREDMTPRNSLVVGAWKTQVHWIDQAWRVFCYLYTPTLFFSGSISTWRVAKRFFAKFFGFLFDNTSWYYLVVASFFPYSYALLLLFIVHVYALEQI